MQSLNLYEKVINGLVETRELIAATKNMFEIGFPNIVSHTYVKALSSIDDALALLKAQSEELDRLKLCRHNCKIECLLDEYNKVVAERDALRKAQEPVAPEKKSFLCAGECEYESTPLMNVCGACGEWLLSAAPRAKYCPNCGREVEWE